MVNTMFKNYMIKTIKQLRHQTNGQHDDEMTITLKRREIELLLLKLCEPASISHCGIISKLKSSLK